MNSTQTQAVRETMIPIKECVTVGKLIARLKRLPQDAEVVVCFTEEGGNGSCMTADGNISHLYHEDDGTDETQVVVLSVSCTCDQCVALRRSDASAARRAKRQLKLKEHRQPQSA